MKREISKLVSNKYFQLWLKLLTGYLFFGKFFILVNIAMAIISYTIYESILLMIFHFLFGTWFFIYFLYSRLL